MTHSAELHQPEAPVIVWFRDDLRLCDNPALCAAVQSGRRIHCIFVYDEESDGLRPLGAAAKWWLHSALASLDEDLRKRGTRLSIYRGRASELVPRLSKFCEAAIVYWNDRYGEAERKVDSTVKLLLEQNRIVSVTFNGSLLYEPASLKSKSGEPFQTFSAFWRAAYRVGDPAQPLVAPAALLDFDDFADNRPHVVALSELRLEPRRPDWSGGLRSNWQPGEAGAQAQLIRFLDNHFDTYAEFRDFADRSVTSRLSPYLRFGNISPRQIWHAAEAKHPQGDTRTHRNLEKFQSELGWREFSYYLLYHHPNLAARNLQSKFDRMPWRVDPSSLRAWQTGKTGYPLIDAGMRQLWATGWMHNRVRMVVASFLVKHLLIDWRQGEAWFWDTLVDADQASNAASWQWVAGSGADAAPYFRIFNPSLQGEKFDSDGHYTKAWVPELSALTSQYLHRPWQISPAAKGYPERIVDHDFARRRALDAFEALS
jgi:deoxyribodipyrimidine photo-lyase